MQLEAPKTKEEFHATLAQIDNAIVRVNGGYRDLSNKFRAAKAALLDAQQQWAHGHRKLTHVEALKQMSETQRRVQSGELPRVGDDYQPMSVLDSMGHYARSGGPDAFVRSRMRYGHRRGASPLRAPFKHPLQDKPVNAQVPAGPVIRGGVPTE